MDLGEVRFAQDGSTEFQELSFKFEIWKEEPTYIYFYTTRNWSTVTNQSHKTYNEGARITRLKLGINGNTRALDLSTADSQERLEHFTSSAYPGYLPRIDMRGGVVAVRFAGLHHGSADVEQRKEITGTIRCAYQHYQSFDRYNYEHSFQLRAALCLKNKFVELHNNHAHSSFIML